MKILFLVLALASCQTYNSNTDDEAKYGPTDLVGGAEFVVAFPIIQSRCINCHTGYHNAWSNYKDSRDWVTNNLIVGGDPDNSDFIVRIFNHGSATSNMPMGGSPLPASEYNALVDWVTNEP